MYFTSGSDRAFEQLMQGKPGFDHYDSGEAVTPEDCGTCRFYRPHWKYQFCVYAECPYQPGKLTAYDAVTFRVKGVENMAVFRVERNKGYTVMSNHHLRNKDLSLKAKGLLSQMLSLPEDWDYTLKGLSGKPIATEAPYGYVKDPDNKDFWIIDEEAAAVVRLIFRLFIGGKNRNQIAVHLKNEQIPTPTFYMKDRGRGTCKNKTLNEDNRYKWNKATLTHILTRQEYCGDVVNFKTTKHFRDKRNHYVDRSQWHITENVHEPIIDRTDFENVQRILENAPVKRPNGDGEIHPLSGLLFCKDCGAKMHIRIDYRNGGKRHVAYCSEYHKGKAKNPKCSSPHIMDADLLMQTVADVLKKIAEYSISNRAEFEALVKKSLAMQQTDKTKKQQKRIPQITTRLEQIDKVLNKLYEDNALGTIPQDRYEQMSQKYSEEYYSLKAELEQLREQLSAFENAGRRAQKFVKLIDRYADFTDLTPTILNEFISRIEVHERDKKRAKQAIQHIGIYFNHIGRFENELTQLAEPTEQEIRQMREEIEEARKEKSRAYHRNYSREYRARNLEKRREYDRIKAREYRAKKKAQAAAALSAP